MTIIKIPINNKHYYGGKEPIHLGGTVKWYMENGMEFPSKIKREVPYDPAIPLMSLYPQKPNTNYHRYIINVQQYLVIIRYGNNLS